jgi:PBSX family phage portal protein
MKTRTRKRVEKSAVEQRIDDVVRSPVAKAFVVGNDGRTREVTNTLDEESTRRAFADMGALAPPYNLTSLCEVFEVSSALRQNVDAYATNIDGNGHRFEPVLDLDADDLHEQIAGAIYIERLAARERGQVVPKIVPTAEEVVERLAQIEDTMRLERFRLEQFFETCTVEESFVSLRRKTRQDLEVTGNGFWEVLRDNANQVAQFVYIPAHTCRLLAQGRDLVDIVVPTRASPISVVGEKLKRRFRRFAQVIDQHRVFFKEFGDPRILSPKTGAFYGSVEALKRAEKGVEPATEVIHFKIHSPKSAYGVPRWIGNLLGVLGSRQAEEVNYLYFENKSVPPMALLVSGGRVTSDSVDALRDFIDTEIKGKRNFHKILVIEGEPAGGDSGDPLASGRMKIELKPLTQAQQSDALFQKYDERNADKVGMSFRLPRLLRGDVRDFNRATADAALEFAEAQVFGPERVEFDFQMNRLVSTLGVRFWTFHSNAVQIRDPKVLAEIIGNLTANNVLVPNDARALAGELVFNRRLPKIDADWVFQPVMLSQVGIPRDMAMDGTIPGLDEETAPAGPGATKPEAGSEEAGAGKAPAKGKDKLRGPATQRATATQKDLTRLAHLVLGLRNEMRKVEDDDAMAAHVEAARALAAEEGAPDPAPAPAKEPETERITMPIDVFVRRFKIQPSSRSAA